MKNYQQIKGIPYPNNENDRYINEITNEIEKLIRASFGHALVLFTSYTPLRKVYRNLEEKEFPFPLVKMVKGRNDALEKYRNSNNGVLLACGSVWEGVNFKGDLLSHLIIVKLPFQIPNPITEYKKTLYKSHQEFRNNILIPEMLIKLRQGHGRAIRSETDTAVISILDSRANGSYKEVVLGALPRCKVTNDIKDIERFIHKNKTYEYFYNN